MKARFLLLLLLISCSTAAKKEKMDVLSCVQIEDRNGLTETIQNKERVGKYEQIDFLSHQPYQKVLRIFEKNKEGKAKSIITSYHPNGQIAELLEAREMRAFGTYRAWFANGQQKIEALVIGGPADLSPTAQQEWLFDGISKAWDEQGNLSAELPYQKGKLHGLAVHYYQNGNIQQTLMYDQDVLEGEVKTYNEEGLLWIQQTYQNNLLEGPSIAYWNSDTPARIEYYQKGKLETGQYFDAEGLQCSEIQKGQGWKTIYHQDGSYKRVEFQKGLPEGRVEINTSEEELISTYTLRNGKKQGTEKHYYLFSEVQVLNRPKLSIDWDSDLIHGMTKTWYPTGKQESQREFAKNQRNGMSFAWYQDGSLMYAEEYELDLLMKGTYYHHGQVISKITDGTGIATIYDNDGVFIRKISYKEGKPTEMP